MTQSISYSQQLEQQIYSGTNITYQQAQCLIHEPLDQLSQAANRLREHFCGSKFDLCTIINGKSGRCSENCRFCAQSAHHCTQAEEYPLLSNNEIVTQGRRDKDRGVLRYSIVTSGRRLNKTEVEQMCQAVRELKNDVGISVCISFGLLNAEDFAKLKEAGVTRVHNNLEAAASFFPQVCTTHRYEDKVNAIKAAQSVGLSVCSGGIFGMGEQWSDRLNMAFELRDLNVDSVPLNMLNPIPGTPLGEQQPLRPEEMQRIVAIYRFILPDRSIRLAGGRALLPDQGETCFRSGANAVISGDMLTTAGYNVETDRQLIAKLKMDVAFHDR